MLYKIEDVFERIDAGGKANGLSFLSTHGFTIPETLVITSEDSNEPALLEGFISPEKKYAVRSSASDEDGADSSFAGQYESFLNVSGSVQISEAIQACRKSLHNKRSESYRTEQGITEEAVMSVIIQEMVEPDNSGVLFTADASAGRFDRMVISIVKGLGEQLVGGHKGGETLYFCKHHHEMPESKFLDQDKLEQIIAEAAKIEAAYKTPVDLEWAISKDGSLYWLQIRPITGLPDEHLNELDHQPAYNPPLYTRGNIGEMMPGPVTPLTLSVFGRAIDLGLQYFYKYIGAIPAVEKNSYMFLHSYYNHLFFDMNALYQFAHNVAMSEKENIEISVSGELIPEKKIPKTKKGIRAWWNFSRMTIMLLRAPYFQKKLYRLAEKIDLDETQTCLSLWEDLNLKIWKLFEAYYYHYITSAQSGSFYTTIVSILSGGEIPTRREQEMIAPLLSNISGIESAEAVKEINNLALCISDLNPEFANMTPENAYNFLTTDAPEVICSLYKKFISNHGHRGIKEAEFRTKAWMDEPWKLIHVLQEKTRQGKNLQVKEAIDSYKTHLSELKKQLKKGQYQAVQYFTPRLRAAVARREATKSASIKFQRKFRSAYLSLAIKMIKAGILEDQDQIFFLTHEEIGRAIKEKNPGWSRKAEARRNLQSEFEELSFPNIIHGIPVPNVGSPVQIEGDLMGIPVSKGFLVGKVRIVEKLEDAEALQKGEIMVARFTDVGWTPYFGLAGGIITEIGSPLSHGAVVAREYGIPAVVSVKGVMQSLSTGQFIELDGLKGTIKLLEPVEVSVNGN